MGKASGPTLLEAMLDALDALDEVGLECGSGGGLLELCPSLARLIAGALKGLERRLGHAVAMLQPDPPDFADPPCLETRAKERRITVRRWWSAEGGVVILCRGGGVYERAHVGPWREVDLRGMTAEGYVQTRPGRWQDRSGAALVLERDKADVRPVEDGRG